MGLRNYRLSTAFVTAVFGVVVILSGAFSPATSTAAETKKAKVVEIKIRELSPQESSKISYSTQIKPLLVDNCLECHSPRDRKGGLDASSVDGLMKGGKKAGPSIIPGKPDESPLVQYVRGLEEPQMPKGSPALSEAELHLLRSWIFAGARDDSTTLAQARTPAKTAATSGEAQSFTTVATNAELQKAMTALLFDTNNEEKFFARRALRLASVPKVAAPPGPAPERGNAIDQFLQTSWSKARLKEATNPPPLCSDAAFVRRVYLDIIGVIPTAAEARKFLTDDSADKRERLVDELLARKQDYAAHWTPFWEEAIGSADVDKVGGIARRGNHRDWIFKSFAENKPFDLMVAELIDPTLPGYRKPIISEANGKRVVAAYIRNETHVDTVQSAANVGQVFMGTGMKCASCHSHFLNKEWPQARFLAFAGMFAPKDLELIRCEKPSGEFIPAKFPFELPGAPPDAPEKIDERLHRAAQLLVDPANPRFAPTIVNRLWKLYFGLGLFEPQDDFRLDREPSQPQLLNWLADDFMRHGYDIKHTARLLLTSRAYQCRYDPALEDHYDVNKAEQAPRYYRSPSLRRLTAEELLDSVRVALTQRLDPKKRTYLDKSSTALTRALGRPASRNEISTARPDDVAVVQALELLNGEEFFDRVYSEGPAGLPAAEENLTHEIEHLYWVALSRAPSPAELKLAISFLKEAEPLAGDQRKPRPEASGKNHEPMGDVLWALFVSPEFQYIR